MGKGVIYVMTTVVPGLIKIGKTGSSNFESRMYKLENDGYRNVTGLQRKFAIEVEDYDEKEKLLDSIFSKSQVFNSELFALDADVVIQLLSSFEGKQVFPKNVSKEDVFSSVTVEIQEKQEQNELSMLPDGTYRLESTVKGIQVSGTMVKSGGFLLVKRGSICAPTKEGYVHGLRKKANIVDNVLQEDVECKAVSAAGWIVLCRSNDGWKEWKDEKGRKIEVYRNRQKCCDDM